MRDQKPSSLEIFISLVWYEAFLRFIANFIAKSSEILLTAGLVVSSANFLSDGSMLKDGTPFAIAWAWTQAIAIDGSLGVSFYSVFHSMRQRDWIKFFLYSVLTVILTLVAWSVTEGDIFSHAINTSNHNAMQLIGIDVRLLSTLRAIAVVGFVLVSRLRDVTLWESSHKATPLAQTTLEKQQLEEEPLSKERIEQIIQDMLQKRLYSVTVTSEDELESIDVPNQSQQQTIAEKIMPTEKKAADLSEGLKQEKIFIQKKETQTTCNKIEIKPLDQKNKELPSDQEERIVQAYYQLEQEGQPISGRALALSAHVRRSTCLEWLRAKTQTTEKQHADFLIYSENKEEEND